MKFKPGQWLLVVIALLSVALPAHAINREDILECGLADGSKFILKSEYQWSLFPFTAGHSSRESHRDDWRISYLDTSGWFHPVPASVHYSNKEANELMEVCSNVGKRNGIPLAAFTYLRDDGAWLRLDSFPWKKLHPVVGVKPDQLSIEQRSQMNQANISSSAYRFAYILPKDGVLVYEQPLFRINNGYVFHRLFDAVYQSLSSDDGKTWSDPIVTTKAEIFEIGKSWVEQSFRARPIKLNEKKIPADFSSSN